MTEDREGKLADLGRANQPGVEDERARRLAAVDEAVAAAQTSGVRDFGPGSRARSARPTSAAGPVQVPVEHEAVTIDASNETDELAPYSIGGGWYQLPNGDKVQGRETALALLHDLQDSGPAS